jgi:hypothetical protein
MSVPSELKGRFLKRPANDLFTLGALQRRARIRPRPIEKPFEC